jgi:hypothetical protein
MHKPVVLMGVAIGAGVAVCAPDIRAYRRLAGISRSLRENAAAQPRCDAAGTVASAGAGSAPAPDVAANDR